MVVALNRFTSDTAEETELVSKAAERHKARLAISEVWEKGGDGGLELAEAVIDAVHNWKNGYKPLYELSQPLARKIEIIAREVYGATGWITRPLRKRPFRISKRGVMDISPYVWQRHRCPFR